MFKIYQDKCIMGSETIINNNLLFQVPISLFEKRLSGYDQKVSRIFYVNIPYMRESVNFFFMLVPQDAYMSGFSAIGSLVATWRLFTSVIFLQSVAFHHEQFC